VTFKHNILLKKVTHAFWLLSLSSTIIFKILDTLGASQFKFKVMWYNKIDLLHLIVAPKLSGGSQHYNSTKTWQAGLANVQSNYSLMSMGCTTKPVLVRRDTNGWMDHRCIKFQGRPQAK
jgi:hypothetical protein